MDLTLRVSHLASIIFLYINLVKKDVPLDANTNESFEKSSEVLFLVCSFSATYNLVFIPHCPTLGLANFSSKAFNSLEKSYISGIFWTFLLKHR